MPRSFNWRSLSLGRQQTKSGASKSVALVVSVAVAAGLAFIIYLTTTSIPFLATSATTDPKFGGLNACLIQALDEPRVGFAVAPDGGQVAAYGGTTVVVCGASGAQTWKAKGIHLAAFDFDGKLWWVTARDGTSPATLWRWSWPAAPARLAELDAVAIAGFAEGVVALDGSGKLIALQPSGNVMAAAEVAGPRAEQPVLSVNVEGTLVMWSAGQGVFVYEATTLKSLVAEAPCQVEQAWWLTARPSSLLLACVPNWALQLDARTGHKEDVARRSRVKSVLLPKAATYVQSCETLPCVAPSP